MQQVFQTYISPRMFVSHRVYLVSRLEGKAVQTEKIDYIRTTKPNEFTSSQNACLLDAFPRFVEESINNNHYTLYYTSVERDQPLRDLFLDKTYAHKYRVVPAETAGPSWQYIL